MKRILMLLLTTAATFLVINALWIVLVAYPMIQGEIGYLLKPFNPLPAIAFYILYIIGLNVFVIYPNLTKTKIKRVLGLGFLFGLVAYGTYDLTNLSIINGWTYPMSLIDMFWGGIVSGVTSLIVTLIFKED